MKKQNRTFSANSENLVSVIIPTFNRRQLLIEAIDSVLSQTYTNYEIIVIDDGSTDGTAEMVNSRYSEKVNYYWQTNQGRSKARNMGLSLAKGKYIAFLDSDDVWLPKKLEKQVQVFTKENSEEMAVVCSSVYFINENGVLIHQASFGQHRHFDDYNLDNFISSPLILAPPSNMLIRKQCLDLLAGFDENLNFGEDWDLIIRLRNRWRFYLISEPLLKFRFSSKFINRLPQADQIPVLVNDLLRIFEKVETNPEFHVDKRLVNKSKSSIWEKAAYWYFANGEYYSAVEILTNNTLLDKIDHHHFFDALGHWGAYSAIKKFGNDPLCCENYFRNDYLPGATNSLKDLIPLQSKEQKIILASFYHNLAWHLFPKVNGKLIVYLNFQAIHYNKLYLLSKQTWKLLCISIISWITSGHK